MRGMVLVVSALVACGAGGSREPTLRERQTALLAAMTDAPDQAARVVAVDASYAQQFPPGVRREALRRGSIVHAQLLFDAAELAALHTIAPAHVDAMAEAYAVLARTGVASTTQTDRLREAMVFGGPDALGAPVVMRPG